MLLGTISYLAVTAFLIMGSKDLQKPSKPEAVQAHSNRGASWDFFNPDVDRLINELQLEKKSLAAREQQLNELAVRLQAERAELNQVTQAVHQLQREFDRNVVRVKEEEEANLKRLAKVYATMTPEGAGRILKQFQDDDIVKLLVFMKDGDSALLLEGLAKGSEADAKRAARISERLRTAISSEPKSKP